jgi:hypothetical protein
MANVMDKEHGLATFEERKREDTTIVKRKLERNASGAYSLTRLDGNAFVRYRK